MPFVQRVVEPRLVCRRRVAAGVVEDELEAVVNVGLSGALRQLSSLAAHADCVFKELGKELDAVRDRTGDLRGRMDSLAAKAKAYNPRTIAVPEGDLSEFSARKEHFVSSRALSTALFTEQSRPAAVRRLCESAARASAAASAAAADAVASAAPCLEGASLASDANSTSWCRNSLGESSWSSAAASKILARAARRLRNLDIETRTPASLTQLRRWTSTEALGCPTVSLGMSVVIDGRSPSEPHRLPSPEEQQSAVVSRFQPETVAVDVSGRGFDRMALFRRSLMHVDCPEGPKRRAPRHRGGRRRKRRNTIAGTGDKELREALAHEPCLEDPASIGRPDDAEEANSIGMSSSAPVGVAALDKKSHFENIRQWTRSKLKGPMVARTRSAVRGEEENEAKTSLPISTPLSGAMSMAVKLRQGAARRATGLARSGNKGSADVNSSSGNWSGSSSARASLESEEAPQRPPPPAKVPPSLSTAPPSTTTSSASSTASSSGGSSTTNSLRRKDARRRAPDATRVSAPSTRALSTSSEGTLTPDLVAVPFADDGETSSVYSCDTEGYYTSFHMDSGLKTLREEEAATVAAFIANGGVVEDCPAGNTSSATAENEYELFGKGSTSTTTSSAGTVCTTLMVRDRPAVPPRQSSLDVEQRQRPCRSVSSFDLDCTTTITKAVVHAMPKDESEDVDSGHNTTSSSSNTSSPTSSPVDPNPASTDKSNVQEERSDAARKSGQKWGTGWSECDYEFSESDLEGVERIERIRVKTTINSSRIPSMCVITPPQSDDEGGSGKTATTPAPVYNTLPRSPSKKNKNVDLESSSLATSATAKSGGSLDNISRVVVSSITGSSKLQLINVSSSGYATVKTVEGREDMGTRTEIASTQTNVNSGKGNVDAQPPEVSKSPDILQSSQKGLATKPFKFMGMVKGVLSSAAEAVKTHATGKSVGADSNSIAHRTNPVDYDRDGEYVTIAEVEKSRNYPVPPVTSAKTFPAFREMEYVSLNELTTNPVAQQRSPLQSSASSPASSLERNKRRQGARVTLDSEGKVVYSSDSLSRSWKNGKAPTSTFEPGPHVKSTSATPASPLPNRIPKTNIRPVNSTAFYNIPPTKPATVSQKSPVTSPTRLGRRLIIRPGNQQQAAVVEAIPTKAAVTALPGPASPKLPHQGAYVNMQTRREPSGCGSPSTLRSPRAGGSWLQPSHMHPMQKLLSPHPSQQHGQMALPATMNHLPPTSPSPNHNGFNPSFQPIAYWTLPTRRSHSDTHDSPLRSLTPNASNANHLNHNPLNSSSAKTNALSHHFFRKSPTIASNNNILPSSSRDAKRQHEATDLYCFKSPSSNPTQTWLIDSNHNVMHAAAPMSSTPTSKASGNLPRHFDGMSPIRTSTPVNHGISKVNEMPRPPLSTFLARTESRESNASSSPTKEKPTCIEQMPLFATKPTMPTDEFFALVHRSKKKMNIRTDFDGRGGSPASHAGLSPAGSDSSLGPSVTVPGSRHSWSPPEAKPSSPPRTNNGFHAAGTGGTRLSWAHGSSSTPPTSRTDFKHLLLQQRHGGCNRVSAAERLRVGKFGGSVGNNAASSPMLVNGSLLPTNPAITPRNRIGAARRFASPRTDVLSSPIPEDKDGEEVGNYQKSGTKKGTFPTHFQKGDANPPLGNVSLQHKTLGNSFIMNGGSQVQINGISKSPEMSSPSEIVGKPPGHCCNKPDGQNNKSLSNHVAKSILPTPSPTLGVLLSKQRRQISPDSSLSPKVKSILEAIQVSKAKSPSKLALETAL